MKPVTFPESNLTLAKNQPQYKQLPVFVADTAERQMVYCHQLTWRERFKIFWSGKLWSSQMTFGAGFNPVIHSAFKSEVLTTK